MDTKRLKSIITPVLFENIGKEVINKRNRLGSTFSLNKHNPTGHSYIQEVTKELKKMSVNERYNADTYITSIKSSPVYKMISTLVEKALELGDTEQIAECRTKVENLLVQYKS